MSELSESDIKAIEEKWVAKIENAESGDALEQLRVEALGKKGEISQLMKLLGGMTPDERGIKGPLLNALKDTVATLIGDKKQSLADAELDARLAEERIDVTLPVRPEGEGSIHPVSQVIEEMTAIFADMGFSIAEGPDIEDDFHNFTALNFPPAHPARDMHDTFFLSQEDGVVPSKSGEGNEPPKVLRTHTSPVQIRHMMTHQPPIRIIVPGRTFRCDSDQTHTPMFHQIEGLVIDTETHMGHLKGCLVEFIKAYFEVDDLNYRFRPHYFPFTEPSAEMDIGYSVEDGNISIGTGEKFMEILGCGMVHPNVLKNCGLDPDTYQGFAFGLGVDRMAMLKYGIPDLRPFFEADMRWLKHYGFRPLDLPTLVGGIAR